MVKPISSAVLLALMAPNGMCQMPRECFYVMDMHGIEFDEDEDLLHMSDLPRLMAKMQPDMRLNTL